MKTTLALTLASLAFGGCSSRSTGVLQSDTAATRPADVVRPAALQEKESTCKLEFVGPGEKCGSYDTCPETAHRSFLWGLIEYDTRIVLCWCLTECDISL